MESSRRYLSIFCNPKPWINEFASIQEAAVTSWKALNRYSNAWSVRVILIGSDEGTHHAASELVVQHDPDVECNQWGTPLLSSIFSLIRKHCAKEDDIACYVNADIVLGVDFIETLDAVVESATQSQSKEWLMVGKRTDLSATPDEIAGGVNTIRSAAMERGVDHGWHGIDYFVFPAQTFQFVYPFALGKFVYDQWLVGNAFRRGLMTVDCSPSVLAVHLNCPWYANGTPSQDREGIYQSEEATINRGFDYYQKTILSGTAYKCIIQPDGSRNITSKSLIPDW